MTAPETNDELPRSDVLLSTTAAGFLIGRSFPDWFPDAGFDADVSVELLESIFTVPGPLHDGAVIVKCWYHYSEKDQRERLKSLARSDRSRWTSDGGRTQGARGGLAEGERSETVHPVPHDT